MSLDSINSIFNVLEQSIMTNNPTLSYSELATKFTEMANLIHALSPLSNEAEEVWYIGESTFVDITDLIVGAYWHYTEWHAGQDSESYAAMCALGEVFNPGISCAPDEDDSEWDVYNNLDQLGQEAIKQWPHL